MKKLFYLWAFLDLEHTCSFKKTYFYQNSDEVAKKNIKMVKGISLIFCILSLFVIAMSLLFWGFPRLAMYYSWILGGESALLIISTLLERKKNVIAINLLATLFLFHILIIGGLIGTFLGQNESAVLYVVALAIAQVIFIFPPIITTLIQGITVIFTLTISYHIKSHFFFMSDVMNCLGVFFLSILLGWYITRIRIEESIARNKAVALTEQLRSLSVTDQLTTLQNHRSFQNTYYQLFETFSHTGQTLGVIMMDIDKFKLFNDNYGHIEGDHCLNAIGKCLASFQTDTISPFRFGGEEFVILLTGDACNQIKDISEQLRQSVEKLAIPHEYSKASNVVTISVGYYLGTPRSATMPMELVDCADQALYMSKEAGGNTVNGTA